MDSVVQTVIEQYNYNLKLTLKSSLLSPHLKSLFSSSSPTEAWYHFIRLQMLVRWVPPSEGAIKLNVDGSSRGNPGRAGCGGLLRDQDGNCITGFVSHIGFAGSIAAELVAIRHGLWLAWQFGYRKVECESDCMVALEIIHDNA
ncbi:hypothetical protein HN51_071425 [Arachis hypogaea]